MDMAIQSPKSKLLLVLLLVLVIERIKSRTMTRCENEDDSI
jgi:hypothetical protein